MAAPTVIGASAASATRSAPNRAMRMARKVTAGRGSVDRDDRVRAGAARRSHRNLVACGMTDDRLRHRRLDGELSVGEARLGCPYQAVGRLLAGLVVAQLHLRAEGGLASGGLFLDDNRAREPLAKLQDLRLEERLLVLGVVVLGVLLEVAEVARDLDPLRDVLAPRSLQLLELGLQLGEPFGRDLGGLGAHQWSTVAIAFVSFGRSNTRIARS